MLTLGPPTHTQVIRGGKAQSLSMLLLPIRNRETPPPSGGIAFEWLTKVANLLRAESESYSNRPLNTKLIYNHKESENQEPNSVFA